MKYQPTPLQMLNSNDNIQTPIDLAIQIIDYYKDNIKTNETILEPCAGDNHIYNYLPTPKYRMELKDGLNFLSSINLKSHYDWIITNPPWSKFKEFLIQSFNIADNVVFLIPLNKVFGLKSTWKILEKYNFQIVNVKCWDTPIKPWPQSGFQIGTVWFKHNYSNTNGCYINTI